MIVRPFLDFNFMLTCSSLFGVIAKVSMSEVKESGRTKTRVLIYIMAVWAFSAFISIPPLLGWKKDLDMSWFDQQKQYQQASTVLYCTVLYCCKLMGLANV